VESTATIEKVSWAGSDVANRRAIRRNFAALMEGNGLVFIKSKY
jgi:hypothetical protein